MRDRIFLALYAAAVVTATMVHDVRLLAAGIAAAMLVAGRRAPRLAKRTALAVLLFHSVVMLSYAAISLAGGGGSLSYVLLASARVFLLTFLTFLLADRVNLFRALAFSRTLSHLFTLAWSQTLVFQRLLGDFRLALRSRALTRLTAAEILRHGGSTAAWFLRKSLHTSTEITQAMKSRGFRRD